MRISTRVNENGNEILIQFCIGISFSFPLTGLESYDPYGPFVSETLSNARYNSFYSLLFSLCYRGLKFEINFTAANIQVDSKTWMAIC